MSWSKYHSESESYAAQAYIARREKDYVASEKYYSLAAQAEERALEELDLSKRRTLGITVVSAVSLRFKAGELTQAEKLASRWLSNDATPDFALKELRLLIQSVWIEKSKLETDRPFLPGQVTVSVDGGDVISGAAPLDLIIDKVQGIQSMLYRTMEYIQNLPHRLKGGPSKEILDACRPWLFQAAPGSYKFAIAIEEYVQPDLFKGSHGSTEVAQQFLEIMKAASDESTSTLENLVPDKVYQNTFLKLARNLTPTGKTFERMEILGPGESSGIILSPESRNTINKKLRIKREMPSSEIRTEKAISGILRAVDLDKDWLDLSTDGSSIHVVGLKDAIDDVIGPMVNKKVVLRVSEDSKGKLHFIDIELDY